MNLSINQKLTVFSIGAMAMTGKTELTIASLLPSPTQTGSRGESLRVGTYKPRGKRKEFYLDIKSDSLVFEGWDLPIISDFEVPRAGGSKSFCGNACLNLGAPSVDVLRDYIDNRNLNDQFSGHGVVLYVAVDSQPTDDGLIVYPDKVTGGHAVIERIKNKLATVNV